MVVTRGMPNWSDGYFADDALPSSTSYHVTLIKAGNHVKHAIMQSTARVLTLAKLSYINTHIYTMLGPIIIIGYRVMGVGER